MQGVGKSTEGWTLTWPNPGQWLFALRASPEGTKGTCLHPYTTPPFNETMTSFTSLSIGQGIQSQYNQINGLGMHLARKEMFKGLTLNCMNPLITRGLILQNTFRTISEFLTLLTLKGQ